MSGQINDELFLQLCDDIFDGRINIGESALYDITLTELSLLISDGKYKFRDVNELEKKRVKKYPVLMTSIYKSKKPKTFKIYNKHINFKAHDKEALRILELDKPISIKFQQLVMDFLKSTNKRKFKVRVGSSKCTYLICDKLNVDGSYRINKLVIEH